MLYIRPLSDLHLEFLNYKYELKELETDKDTVLILAGNIGIGYEALYWIKSIHKRFKAVLYILGNHEFYYNDIELFHDNIITKIYNFGMDNNVFCLNNNSMIIENYNFIGSTLCTNFNNNNPLTIFDFDKVSDSKLIFKNNIPIKPNDVIEIFNESISYIKNELTSSVKKNIIITHHSPSFNLDRPHSFDTGLFSSSLEYMMFDYPIDFWIFGHTHFNITRRINNTICLTNQLGYPSKLVDNFHPDWVLKLC